MRRLETLRVESDRQSDPGTGRAIRRWTDLAANDQLLYFTSPSLSEDGRWIAVISDRGGNYNIWALDRTESVMHRISDNHEGFLRSYVYFDGRRDNRGLARASVSFDAIRNCVYYIQGRQVMRADIDAGEAYPLLELKPDDVTAFTHVSHCGRYLCVPTIDRAPFDATLTGQQGSPWRPNQVGRAADATGIRSNVRVFEVATGKEVFSWEEPGWVTHVQFRPTDPRQVLYNHEWCDFSATRRMWLWNGYQSTRLRPADDLVDPRGGAVHEVWCRDGRSLIYHGVYAINPAGPTAVQKARGIEAYMPYVGRCYPDGDFRIEIPLRPGCNAYGHFMPDPAGERVVSDGYFRRETGTAAAPVGGRERGRWITVFHLDWDALTARPEPLCRHDSSWGSQDAHPHPIFAPDGSSIWFTSDREGARAIYEVDA